MALYTLEHGVSAAADQLASCDEVFAEAQSNCYHPAARPVAFTLPPSVLDDLERFLPLGGYHLAVMVTLFQGAT